MDLSDSVEQLKKFNNITFVLGEHRLQDFVNRDYILVAAGVPMNSEFLRHARAAGVPQKQSAALFAELSGIPIIGVTGTRGKSTVTHMIHHVISELTGEPVLLGGNVRGVSNLQLLKDVKEDSIAVMELDSWQLQGFGWAKISPQISVFTNFMPDHMNYYKNDMDAYFSDKANIFRYQDESGVLITIPEVFERAKKMTGITLGQEIVLVDESVIPEDMVLSMPGEHNRLNAAIAYEALKATGLMEEEIFAGLASFGGVPGRLEYLGERSGVKIYNDNNSTIPEATIKGLEAVGNKEDKNVILIAGGAYKEIDPQPLVKIVPQFCKKVILLAGTGTDLIKDIVESEVVNSVGEAVRIGLAYGEPGDVLLFSPGFASFGMFKNEYERNDEFVRCLKTIEE
jgi:UDP-N-acetylmuramoylalanine--D-glutamate ligase